MVLFRVEIIHISKFKPGRVEKNIINYKVLWRESNLRLCDAGAMLLPTYLRSLVVRPLHRHRKGVGSIPAGGPIVDDVFSTVPGLNFDMCMISTRNKTIYPSDIKITGSQLKFLTTES